MTIQEQYNSERDPADTSVEPCSGSFQKHRPVEQHPNTNINHDNHQMFGNQTISRHFLHDHNLHLYTLPD